MTMKMIVTLILLPLLTVAASVAAAPNTQSPVVLRVERGDTFSNLFGPDWEKAFEQNRKTVMRRGVAVTSPDILIEGSILRISGNVHLTPRALERVKGLAWRRIELRDFLTQVGFGGGRTRERASELLRDLDDDLQYVTDLDYIEREAVRLRPEPGPIGQPDPLWVWVGSGFAAVAIWLGWFLRQRRDGPTGDQRMKAALGDLNIYQPERRSTELPT
jgi:hypothetical protein